MKYNLEYIKLNISNLPIREISINFSMDAPANFKFICWKYTHGQLINSAALPYHWFNPITGLKSPGKSYQPAKIHGGQPNKFLHGSLCWSVDEECVDIVKNTYLKDLKINQACIEILQNNLSKQWKYGWYNGDMQDYSNGFFKFNRYGRKLQLLGAENLNHYMFIDNLLPSLSKTPKNGNNINPFICS